MFLCSGLKAFCWVFGGLVPIYTVVSSWNWNWLSEGTYQTSRNVLGIWTSCVYTAVHCRLAFAGEDWFWKLVSTSFGLRVIVMSNFYECIRKLQSTVYYISLCWEQLWGQEERIARKALWTQGAAPCYCSGMCLVLASHVFLLADNSVGVLIWFILTKLATARKF